jgi:hypothetical protein
MMTMRNDNVFEFGIIESATVLLNYLALSLESIIEVSIPVRRQETLH